MHEPDVGSDRPLDAASLKRRVNQLATERGVLFEKSGASFGLSPVDQQRLGAIERELDQCFLARRRLRAERDARLFDRETPHRARVPRRPTS
jgi:hypothetical protein